MLSGTNDGTLQVSQVDTVMPLSDPAIKNAKSTEKPYKMPDEKGMYLLVNPNGGKYFRLDYRFGGKRKTLALGVYPDTSLKQAREKRDTAKKQIADGIDPCAIKKEDKITQDHTFEKVTRDWFASVRHTVREITQQKKIRRFERFVFPVIGNMVHAEIKSPDIYKIIKPLIAKHQLETAHRVHSEIGAAFAYAIAHGFTDYDPAQAVAGQIPAQKVKHRAALTEPKDVAQLLSVCFKSVKKLRKAKMPVFWQ